MTELFVKSLDCELRDFYESYDMAMAQLRCDFLESLEPVTGIFEAGDDKNKDSGESGGLVGLITSFLRTISNFVRNAAKKLKKFLTGAKPEEGKENEKVNLKVDPNTAVKFLTGSYKDHRDALAKAARGQMTVEDAKAFVQKQDEGFGKLGGCVMSVGAALAAFAGKQMLLDKWADEANEMRAKFERDNGENASNSVAHQYSDKAKEAAAREASNIIINSYDGLQRKGIMSLLDPIKHLYQKNLIRSDLMAEADDAHKKGSALKRRVDAAKTVHDNNREARGIFRRAKSRNKYYDADKKARKSEDKSRQKIRDIIADNYTDANAKRKREQEEE